MANIDDFLRIAALRSEALATGDRSTAELCERGLLGGESSLDFARAWAEVECRGIESELEAA